MSGSLDSPTGSSETKIDFKMLEHYYYNTDLRVKDEGTIHTLDFDIIIIWSHSAYWYAPNMFTELDIDSPSYSIDIKNEPDVVFVGKEPPFDSTSHTLSFRIPDDEKGRLVNTINRDSGEYANDTKNETAPPENDSIIVNFDRVKPRFYFEEVNADSESNAPLLILGTEYVLKFYFTYPLHEIISSDYFEFSWSDPKIRGLVSNFEFNETTRQSGSMRLNFPDYTIGSVTVTLKKNVTRLIEIKHLSLASRDNNLSIKGPGNENKEDLSIELKYDATKEVIPSTDLNLFISNPTAPTIEPENETIEVNKQDEIRGFYEEDKFGRLVDKNGLHLYNHLNERINNEVPVARRHQYLLGEFTYDNFPDSPTFLQYFESRIDENDENAPLQNSRPPGLPDTGQNDMWKPVDKGPTTNFIHANIKFIWYYRPQDPNFVFVDNFLYKDIQIRQYKFDPTQNKFITLEEPNIIPLFRVEKSGLSLNDNPSNANKWAKMDPPHPNRQIPRSISNNRLVARQYNVAFELPINSEGVFEVRVGSQNGSLPFYIAHTDFGQPILDANGDQIILDTGEIALNDLLTPRHDREITYSIYPDQIRKDIEQTLRADNNYNFHIDHGRVDDDNNQITPPNASGPRAARRPDIDPSINDSPSYTVTSGPIYFDTKFVEVKDETPSKIKIDEHFFACFREHDLNEILDDSDGTYLDNEFFEMYVTDDSDEEADIGGGFVSLNEMIAHDNYIYFAIQIRRSDVEQGNKKILTERYQTHAALCYIDKTDIDESHPTSLVRKMTIIKIFEFSDHAPRSFALHEGVVHFFEGSQYGYNSIAVGDFDGIRDHTYFNKYKPGSVYKIIDDMKDTPPFIEYVSGAWQSDVTVTDKLRNEYQGENLYLSHAGTISPLVSTSPNEIKDDSELNLIIGAGDLNKLIKYQIGPLPTPVDKKSFLQALIETVIDFLLGASADDPEEELEFEAKIVDHNTLIAAYESVTLGEENQDGLEPAIGRLEANALNADINNWNWLTISRKLQQRLPLLHTNKQKPFDIIKQLAYLTHSIIGYDTSVESHRTIDGLVNEVVTEFFVKPRDPYVAQLAETISPTIEVIPYTNENREFDMLHPADGSYSMFLIEQEIIGYTLLSPAPTKEIREANPFLPVIRGFKQTEAVEHIQTTKITHINHIIELEESAFEVPINKLDYRDDSSQLYNQIEIKYNNRIGDELIYRLEDEESIRVYGERETSFEIPLDRHQLPWIEYIARQFLDRNKDMHYLFTIILKPTFYLQLGDIVIIRQRWRDRTKTGWHIFVTAQVYDIRQSFSEQTTTCVFRTV